MIGSCFQQSQYCLHQNHVWTLRRIQNSITRASTVCKGRILCRAAQMLIIRRKLGTVLLTRCCPLFPGWLSDEGVVRRVPRGRRADAVRLPQPNGGGGRRARTRAAARRLHRLRRLPRHLPRHPERGCTFVYTKPDIGT